MPLLQALAVASKAGLLAAIDELEKMTASLKEALKEELVAAAADARKEALAEAESGASAGAGLQLGVRSYHRAGAGHPLTAARCPCPAAAPAHRAGAQKPDPCCHCPAVCSRHHGC